MIFSAELSKLVLCKVAEAAKGLRRNVWTLTKTLSFLCRHIKICGNLHTLAKKGFFLGVKNCVSCARSALLHGIYHIELDLQTCNHAKNDAFVAKIANPRLTKISKPIFALAGRLPTSATLCGSERVEIFVVI